MAKRQIGRCEIFEGEICFTPKVSYGYRTPYTLRCAWQGMAKQSELSQDLYILSPILWCKVPSFPLSPPSFGYNNNEDNNNKKQ